MDRSQQRHDEHLASEAADWFARLRSSDHSDPQARAQFSEWLLRSPNHVLEYLAAVRAWHEAAPEAIGDYSIEALTAAAKDSAESGVMDNVVALPSASQRTSPLSRPRRAFFSRTVLGRAMAAISFVAALGAGLWFLIAQASGNYIRTAVGEQRSVTLADGSVIDINTNSAIRIDVEGSRRTLSLVRGEARFKVAKDPTRPFIVTTPQATVRALGTMFNVQAQDAQTAVAVLEGSVEVRELATPAQPDEPASAVKVSPGKASVANASSSSLRLQAGQLASVTNRGEIIPGAGPSLERVSLWTERRLVFRNEALADVVAEFNRYHTRAIRIEDPALAAIRINGTFDSSDRLSLLDYLKALEGVRVDERGDTTLLVGRGSGVRNVP
jgi:transmembrane sensor